jgi:hypothetical protein
MEGTCSRNVGWFLTDYTALYPRTQNFFFSHFGNYLLQALWWRNEASFGWSKCTDEKIYVPGGRKSLEFLSPKKLGHLSLEDVIMEEAFRRQPLY